MARIATVENYSYRETPEGFKIGDVLCDIGGKRSVTASHYAAPGENDHPLPGDMVVIQENGRGFVTVAFWDPQLALDAEAGEKVLSSRSGPGQTAAVHRLKVDGTHEMSGAEFVAMAELVLDELNRIGDDMTTLKSAIGAGFTAVGVSTAANGPAGKAKFDLDSAAVPSAAGSVASTKLKTS